MENENDRNLNQADKPSQAEGDRETIEEDLGEPSDINRATQGKVIPSEGRPSQAEGDRETVEADLAGKARQNR